MLTSLLLVAVLVIVYQRLWQKEGFQDLEIPSGYYLLHSAKNNKCLDKDQKLTICHNKSHIWYYDGKMKNIESGECLGLNGLKDQSCRQKWLISSDGLLKSSDGKAVYRNVDDGEYRWYLEATSPAAPETQTLPPAPPPKAQSRVCLSANSIKNLKDNMRRCQVLKGELKKCQKQFVC